MPDNRKRFVATDTFCVYDGQMKPTPELIKEAIKAAGGASAIAKARDISPAAVNNWPQRGYIPAAHCPTIERLCAGLFLCEQMRPDVEWGVLRGASAATVTSSAAPSDP